MRKDWKITTSKILIFTPHDKKLYTFKQRLLFTIFLMDVTIPSIKSLSITIFYWGDNLSGLFWMRLLVKCAEIHFVPIVHKYHFQYASEIGKIVKLTFLMFRTQRPLYWWAFVYFWKSYQYRLQRFVMTLLYRLFPIGYDGSLSDQP